MTGMSNYRISKRALATGVAILCLFGAGCATPEYTELKSFVQGHDHGDVGASRYRIEPPDVITISSPSAPELDGKTRTVGIDGKISLELLGDVKVSRLTPRETASKLEDLLSRYYVDPKVHVRVVGPRSKKIYVLGEVGSQGPMPFTGRDTVLDVLSRARLTFLSWGSQVKVIRPSAAPGERRELVVDVDKIMKTGDTRANFLLQPGDIVYVPPTPLGWVGLRVREVLFPVSPVLSAYQTPAYFMEATDRYQDRLDDD
jgi:polysaccharide export outer membrane protein